MTFRTRFLCLGLFALLSACTANDTIPQYGYPEVRRSLFDQTMDQEFVKYAIQERGTREQASRVWFEEGEEYLKDGDLDWAMRRFNEAWLLDPGNFQPYWGFARVLLAKGDLDEAIKYFERAEFYVRDSYQKPELLADMGAVYGTKGRQSPDYFAKANQTFAESVALDTKAPETWRRWAFSLHDEGDYAGAWEKVEKAQSLNARPFPADFLASLRSKAPEPK